MPFERTMRGLWKGNSRVQLIKLASQLPVYVKLLWGLTKDSRVPAPAKAMLVAALAYILSPIDIIPDFIPILGQVDDVVLFLTVWRAFEGMCPKDVWNEHLRLVRTGESDFDRDFAWLKANSSGLVDYIERNLDRILQRYSKDIDGRP